MSATELPLGRGASAPAPLPPMAMRPATGLARAAGAGGPAVCPLKAAWDAKTRRGDGSTSICARARKGD